MRSYGVGVQRRWRPATAHSACSLRSFHDAVQVIAFFNYWTRLADGLGVEQEEFIEPWGAK
jgi:hypothetical protein